MLNDTVVEELAKKHCRWMRGYMHVDRDRAQLLELRLESVHPVCPCPWGNSSMGVTMTNTEL